MEEDRLIEGIGARFLVDLARVEFLAGHSGSAPDVSIVGGSDLRSEIRRCAIVLLHATLETLLRSLGLARYRSWTEEALNSIPLYEAGRSEKKFLVGFLVKHRELRVDDLIFLSIAAHLERESYNDVAQILRLLETIGLPHRLLDEQDKANLAAMTRRRHLIAHRADRIRSSEGVEVIDQLEAETVDGWIASVRRVGEKVLHACDASDPSGG
ncbi:MAG: hypothetical protein JWN86_889 [Planctomycetota bacterium]|nr:hypothetical protein [Planctomycetota bacterium]